MVRKWMVQPDPETGVANRQEIIEALMDGEALLARAGGVLEVVVSRVPTGMPGEMVTQAAIFAWKDRTDAKAQPEAVSGMVVPDPTPEELERSLEAEDVEEAFLREAEASEDTSAMETTA